MPWMPPGAPLFSGLPLNTVLLAALPAAVEHGWIIVEDRSRTGVIVVRNAAVSRAFATDQASARTGSDPVARMSSWSAATVSATRVVATELDLVEVQLDSKPTYTDLQLSWTVLTDLLADLCSRGEDYLVTVRTPAGIGAVVIRDGVQQSIGARSDPGNIEFDQLATSNRGSINVYRLRAEAAAPSVETVQPRDLDAPPSRETRPEPDTAGPPAMASPSSAFSDMFGLPGSERVTGVQHETERVAQPPVTSISDRLPDLKLLVRTRLRLSSQRVETLLDDAAASHLPIDSVAEQIRRLSIRGVMPSTMEQLADDVLALAGSTVR